MAANALQRQRAVTAVNVKDKQSQEHASEYDQGHDTEWTTTDTDGRVWSGLSSLASRFTVGAPPIATNEMPQRVPGSIPFWIDKRKDLLAMINDPTLPQPTW